MARLNEQNPPGESLDALKKRYIKQNREIARANSAQSLRIRCLESESTQLLEENISLREQVIKLTVELERRDRAHEALQHVSATKTALEGKMKEIMALVGGLNIKLPDLAMDRREKLAIAPKPVEERVWRNAYIATAELEGLETIEENGVASPARSIVGRRSLSMDDVPVLSPRLAAYDDFTPDSDDDDEVDGLDDETARGMGADGYPEPAPISSFLDMRPRRRRDSSMHKNKDSENTTPQAVDPPVSESDPMLSLPIRPRTSSQNSTSSASSTLSAAAATPTSQYASVKSTRRFEDVASPPQPLSVKDSFALDEMVDSFTFRAPSDKVSSRSSTSSSKPTEDSSSNSSSTRATSGEKRATSEAAADEIYRRLSTGSWSAVEEANRRLSGGKSTEDSEQTGSNNSSSSPPIISHSSRRERRTSARVEDLLIVPVSSSESRSSRVVETTSMPTLSSSQSEDRHSSESSSKQSKRASISSSASLSSLSTTTAPVSSRKALGPKTVNADLSPQKSLPASSITSTLTDTDLKLKTLDLPLPPPTTISLSTTTTTPLITLDSENPDDQGASTSRPSRRARASVNYALPSLRQKMRRDSTYDPTPTNSSSALATTTSHSSSSSKRSRTSTSSTSSRAGSVDPDDVETNAARKRVSLTSSSGDVYEYNPPSTSNSADGGKRLVVLEGVSPVNMPVSYRRREAGVSDEEEEDERERERERERRRRKRVSFSAGGSAAGAPEEREKGRSSFGGGGGGGGGGAGSSAGGVSGEVSSEKADTARRRSVLA